MDPQFSTTTAPAVIVANGAVLSFPAWSSDPWTVKTVDDKPALTISRIRLGVVKASAAPGGETVLTYDLGFHAKSENAFAQWPPGGIGPPVFTLKLLAGGVPIFHTSINFRPACGLDEALERSGNINLDIIHAIDGAQLEPTDELNFFPCP